MKVEPGNNLLDLGNKEALDWVCKYIGDFLEENGIDYYRQEKSENTVSADDEDTNLLNRRDLCEENIEYHMVTDQIHKDVNRIIMALPESQRDVLIMRYYRDMSFKEIADATNVSINTALGRMRYAILNMRRIAEENNIVLTM